MCLNDVPFFTSIVNYVHYCAAKGLNNIEAPSLEMSLKNIICSYAICGFSIGVIFLDNQFKCIKHRNQVGILINLVSKGKNRKLIECFYRLIKEHCRCHYTTLPYDSLPRMMVVHLMITVIFYINTFVWKSGTSKILSPLTILEGIMLDYNLHFRVIFSEFVQTYEGTRDDMIARTVDPLALGPNRNLQGGIRCFSLVTGYVLQQ